MTTTNEVRFRCYGCGGWSTDPETCTACGKVAPPMSISRKVQSVKPIPATLPDEPCEKCASGYCCPLERVTEQRDELRAGVKSLAEALSKRSAVEYHQGRRIDAEIYLDFAAEAFELLARIESEATP